MGSPSIPPLGSASSAAPVSSPTPTKLKGDVEWTQEVSGKWTGVMKVDIEGQEYVVKVRNVDNTNDGETILKNQATKALSLCIARGGFVKLSGNSFDEAGTNVHLTKRVWNDIATYEPFIDAKINIHSPAPAGSIPDVTKEKKWTDRKSNLVLAKKVAGYVLDLKVSKTTPLPSAGSSPPSGAPLAAAGAAGAPGAAVPGAAVAPAPVSAPVSAPVAAAPGAAVAPAPVSAARGPAIAGSAAPASAARGPAIAGSAAPASAVRGPASAARGPAVPGAAPVVPGSVAATGAVPGSAARGPAVAGSVAQQAAQAAEVEPAPAVQEARGVGASERKSSSVDLVDYIKAENNKKDALIVAVDHDRNTFLEQLNRSIKKFIGHIVNNQGKGNDKALTTLSQYLEKYTALKKEICDGDHLRNDLNKEQIKQKINKHLDFTDII